MTVQTMDLTTMDRSALDELFRSSPPGPIPTGRSRGTAIIAPGSVLDGLFRLLIRALIWKGKVFRAESHDLKNRLGPIGTLGIRANVYQDESWFSPGPAIILDYSKTSFVARMIRDEIRQVAPNVYLGQIYLWKRRVGLFCLEFPA
ncbi:MAG TPA: hypothetical protein VJ997_09335 [Longimicrobiales bacterium]|nr:hypothetical protein [Longimicrobiales bacterium]